MAMRDPGTFKFLKESPWPCGIPELSNFDSLLTAVTASGEEHFGHKGDTS